VFIENTVNEKTNKELENQYKTIYRKSRNLAKIQKNTVVLDDIYSCIEYYKLDR
jgi:Skp family chaperone for outer membrane proteins